MEPRARIRTLLRRAGISAALAALMVPAAAGTASAAKHHHHRKAKLPVITSVRPMKAAIGDTLTIRGRNFRRGIGKNTVIFRRAGARPVFVKAGKGTTKLLKVTLGDKLKKGLRLRNGVPVATRFSLRVLAQRLGRRFTARRHSPVIDPARAPTTNRPPNTAPSADCDGDGTANKVDADDDNDLLPDTLESSLKLDSCNSDTDGDGVPDGYEYRSARDLNDDDYQGTPNDYQPYPGKRPYPNPLDGTDARTDYDGDSLTLGEEYQLWRYTRQHEGAPYDLNHLTYSDGEQYTFSTRDASGRRVPSMPVGSYTKHQQFVQWATSHRYRDVTFKVRPLDQWNDASITPVAHTFGLFDVNLDGETPAEVAGNSDLDGDGFISDDERDEDGDGLSNYDEAHGRMLPGYWSACYGQEAPFKIHYAGTSLVDADSDGDGILDGADDQDHDDIPNLMELSRYDASGRFDGKRECVPPDPPPGATTPIQNHPQAYGQVNPFNPCLPARWSRTCLLHPDLAGDSAPFDLSPDWYALN